MTIYADTSFVASYYLQDVHSTETDRRMNFQPVVSITQLNRTELAHAMQRYVVRGKMTL